MLKFNLFYNKVLPVSPDNPIKVCTDRRLYVYIFHGSAVPAKVADKANAGDDTAVLIQWHESKSAYQIIQYRDRNKIYQGDELHSLLSDISSYSLNQRARDSLMHMIRNKPHSAALASLKLAIDREALIQLILERTKNSLLKRSSNDITSTASDYAIETAKQRLMIALNACFDTNARLDEPLERLASVLENTRLVLDDKAIYALINQMINEKVPAFAELNLLCMMIHIAYLNGIESLCDVILCLDGNLRTPGSPMLSASFHQCVEAINASHMVVFSNTPACRDAASSYFSDKHPAIQVVETKYLKDAVSALKYDSPSEKVRNLPEPAEIPRTSSYFYRYFADCWTHIYAVGTEVNKPEV